MCAVLQEKVLPGSVLSHSTAAALLGIALPASLDGGIAFHLPRAAAVRSDGEYSTPMVRSSLQPRLHARVLPHRHRTAGRRAVVHQALPAPRAVVDGLVVSHPAEVLFELATILGHSDLVAAVDSILGPRWRGRAAVHSAPSRETLREYAHAAPPGRRGTRALLRAIDDAREGVESPAETYTRLLVVAAGFPEPTVNLPVADEISGIVRRIDGAYEPQRLGIEFDGDVHRVGRRAWLEDERRRDGLAASGWLLRRLTGADLVHPDDFLMRLHRGCLERGVPAPLMGSWRGKVLLEGAMDYPGRCLG